MVSVGGPSLRSRFKTKSQTGNSDLVVTGFVIFFFDEFEFQNMNYQFHTDLRETGMKKPTCTSDCYTQYRNK